MSLDRPWQFVQEQVLLCAFYLHVSALLTYSILVKQHEPLWYYMLHNSLVDVMYVFVFGYKLVLCKLLTMNNSIWFVHHSLNATQSDKAQNEPNRSLVNDVTLISKIAFLLIQSCIASPGLLQRMHWQISKMKKISGARPTASWPRLCSLEVPDLH